MFGWRLLLMDGTAAVLAVHVALEFGGFFVDGTGVHWSPTSSVQCFPANQRCKFPSPPKNHFS